MAAKATLMLDEERIRSGRGRYGCAANTRNGACPNNTYANKSVGTYGEDGYMTFSLCRRHDRMFEAEAVRMVGVIRSEHDNGLHGEGEDRRAFAEPHVRAEFFMVHCKPCEDELASEDLGVKPEQVQQANIIKSRRKRHQEAVVSFTERLTKMVEGSGAVEAVAYMADDAKTLKAADDLWLRVQAFEEGAYSWNSEGSKMNLVDAYEKVAGEQRERLVNDRCRDETERYVASSFIRMDLR